MAIADSKALLAEIMNAVEDHVTAKASRQLEKQIMDILDGYQVATVIRNDSGDADNSKQLIDADALVEDLKRQCEEVFNIDAVSPDDFWMTRDQAYNERLWKTWCESFFEYLKTRETVIPASEEG